MTTAEATTLSLSYYPGCCKHGTGIEYDESTRSVCRALGIDLREVEDWNCCGATSAHALDPDLAVALGARNLALVERDGLGKVVVPCAACFSRLRHAAAHVADHGTPIGLPEVHGTAAILHLLDLLATPERLAEIASLVRTDLSALRAVPYYGCLIVRPPSVTGCSEPENPSSMDRLLAAAGVEVRSWPYKTRCCGTSLAMTRTEVVEALCTELAAMARRAGAEVLVVACPLCFVNLDSRQRSEAQMPVLYFTELLALAMGLEGSRATLWRHGVSPKRLLAAKGIA